jgi:hypothetical protein
MTTRATVPMIRSWGQLKSSIAGSGLLVVGWRYVAGDGRGLFDGRFASSGGLIVVHTLFESGDTFANFAHQGRNFAFAKQDKNNDGDQK